MPNYAIKDLQANKMYRCTISNLPVFVIHQPTKWTDTQQGRIVSEFQVFGLYWNAIAGEYKTIAVYDNQLIDQ